MHAIFRDGQDRIVDCVTGVPLDEAGSWLPLRHVAVRCDVYADNERVRGDLVASFARDGDDMPWRRVFVEAQRVATTR